MLLLDANVLIHSVNESAREHERAHAWLEPALNEGPDTLGFAWTVSLAFLRLATSPAIFARPLDVAQAGEVLESWLEAPRAVVVEPTRRHLSLLRGLLATTGAAGNLVPDAHLAALALEHDATIVSFDRDFGRFEGLRWRLPE